MGTAWTCGESVTFLAPGTRTVLACVLAPDHPVIEAHRSGTLPVVRWRTSLTQPGTVDVWIEQEHRTRC